jgi:rare lipoprotein A
LMKTIRIASGILCCLALSCVMSSCGTKKKIKAAKPAHIGSSETGIASWYGDPYHGRHAANGEIYDMEKLTAAHRTLPFGTWVRVKNLTNDKTVDVRIQDRGPFVGNRIIDLSRAAAREIEMIGPGTTKVRLTVIAPSQVRGPLITVAANPAPVKPARTIPVPAKPVEAKPIPDAEPVEVGPPPPPPATPDLELFAVQIGAFQDRAKAESIRAKMAEAYGGARIVVREGKTPFYRVLVGEEASTEKAVALAERMRGDGSDGFVVRLDPIEPPK